MVGVFLGGVLSGTLGSAQAAVNAAGINGVHLRDSRSASVGLGLLALRGAELAEAGWPAAAIAKELVRVRDQSGLLLTVDVYDNLIRSGRVSKGKAWLGGLLDIKPILEVDAAGRLQPVDRRGRDRGSAMLARITGGADAAPQVDPLRHRPRRGARGGRTGADGVAGGVHAAEIIVGPATGVLGTHVGSGAGRGVPSRGWHPRAPRWLIVASHPRSAPWSARSRIARGTGCRCSTSAG